MATRAPIAIMGTASGFNQATWQGGGVNSVVYANNGAWYQVYVNSAVDVAFVKSTDNGLTWSKQTTVFTGTVNALGAFYDRWSGLATDKIRCVYIDSVSRDIIYRDIDTASSDALGTQTTVFAGASVAADPALTICAGRDGRLMVAGSIDEGAEDGAWSSTDDGATWGDTVADPSEAGAQDQYLLLPGWNADTADMQLIFWDASANAISVKRYDDSANTWAETSIFTSMTDIPVSTSFRNFDACVDLTNSRNFVIGWSNSDTLNADLRCAIVTDTTVTEVTNVVQNSVDDQGLCAIGLDTNTGYLYVFYGGKSDGSETYNTDINIYYKVSTDAGTTWGAETKLTGTADTIAWMVCPPRFATNFIVNYAGVTARGMVCNAPIVTQRAPSLTGGMAV